MKKRIINNIIKVVSFCLIVAVLLWGVNEYFNYSDPANTAIIQGFYNEPEDSLDVVLVGASEVYADYCAVTAYEKYGFTSYALSQSGIPGTLYKSMLREVVERQNPKVLVIEINGFLQKNDYYERVSKLKDWIKRIPDEERRQLAFDEVVPEDQKETFNKNTLEMNHNNWTMFVMCAASVYGRVRSQFAGISDLKGYCTKGKSSNPDADMNKGTKKIWYTKRSQECLEDLLDFCDTLDVENIVFARFPHDREFENPEVIDELGKTITDHNYEFWNFEGCSEEIGLEHFHDFYNSEHLNIYGAEKFTDYLCEKLISKYNVANLQHTDEIKEQWDNVVPKFNAFVKTMKERVDENEGGFYFEYRQ